MSNKLVPLRGMKDILPEEFRIYKHIENTALSVAQLYGYEAMSTPLLESANVFDRTLGTSSDVVSKEMYSFLDKKDRQIALRPEFTAGIIRAFLSNGLKHKLPLKYFSTGPVFRYDRPQEGRQRQFHQLNFEHIGAKGAYSDAEAISLAAHILKKLNLLDGLKLELNSLGCKESRSNYQAALVKYFKKHTGELSQDSKNRLEANPLRILDSKDLTDIEISKNAPSVSDYYTESAGKYFEQVKSYLDILEIKYTENQRLVRGLDYYSHTAFEFTTDKLGAQATVLAGGRYDGLAELMGGEETPAIGFAAGIERLILMSDFSPPQKRPISVMAIDAENQDCAILIADYLRNENLQIRLELNDKFSKSMKAAIAANSSHAIFIGDEEQKNNMYKLKDLDKKTEQSFNRDNLIAFLKEL